MGSPYLVRAPWVRPLLASLVSTTLASPRAADEDDRLMVVTSPLACKAVLGVCSARMTPRVAKMRLLASMTFYECLKDTGKELFPRPRLCRSVHLASGCLPQL
jgi:hypothetical protein